MDTAQAFQDGIDAFADGKTVADCPFSAQAQREFFDAWMAGWANERTLSALKNKG